MKTLVIVISGFVLIVGILGFLAPTTIHVEREIVIKKPKNIVFTFIKYMKNNDKWSPWTKMDPNMQKQFFGTDGTIGAISSWKGNNKVGEGEQEIKAIKEDERIDYQLRFKAPMEGTSTAYLATEAVGETDTKVKWGFDSHVQFPVNIMYLVINMKNILSETYDSGLRDLKNLLEQSNSF